MRRGNSDVGLQAVQEIRELLQVDEKWSRTEDRSFTWIAYRLVQLIVAEPPVEDDGIVISRVRVSVLVVKDVMAPKDEAQRVLAELNRYSIGSAYFYDSDMKSIFGTLSGVVHGETLSWRAQQIGHFATSQICQAESEADFLAGRLRGRVAVQSHPTAGFRTVPDDMLNALDIVTGRNGLHPSRFAISDEFEEIAELAKQGNTATVGGSAAGISIEVPFGDVTALIRISTDRPHRRVGNGLSVSLCLPSAMGADYLSKVAADLNEMESSGESPTQQFGAWALSGRYARPTLAFQTFVPNDLYLLNVTRDCFIQAVIRGRWINALFYPDAPIVNAWEILAARYREGAQ